MSVIKPLSIKLQYRANDIAYAHCKKFGVHVTPNKVCQRVLWAHTISGVLFTLQFWCAYHTS